MELLRRIGIALLLTTCAAGLGACGGDDDDDDDNGGDADSAAQCHCEWGDSCDEYSSGCAFTACESNGVDVMAQGACSENDVIGTCRCAAEHLVTYYRSGTTNPREACEFWCDDGVYTPR